MKLLVPVALLALSLSAIAAPVPDDLSGVYDCKGIDASEGAYTGTVTLTRQAKHSVEGYGAYQYLLEVPGYGRYPGQAVSLGNTLAIHFALTDPKPHDFGTGIATVKLQDGKPAFHKFYYEPEFKGGNHGIEDCRRR